MVHNLTQLQDFFKKLEYWFNWRNFNSMSERKMFLKETTKLYYSNLKSDITFKDFFTLYSKCNKAEVEFHCLAYKKQNYPKQKKLLAEIEQYITEITTLLQLNDKWDYQNGKKPMLERFCAEKKEMENMKLIKKVDGMEFLTNGKDFEVHTKNEIISFDNCNNFKELWLKNVGKEDETTQRLLKL